MGVPVIVVVRQFRRAALSCGRWCAVVTRARRDGPGRAAVASCTGSSDESSPPQRPCQEAFSSQSP